MADDTKFDYIVHRLDVVDEKVSDIGVSLATNSTKFDSLVECVYDQRNELKRISDILNRNTASLEFHIERTNLLEKYVKKLDERFTPMELESIHRKAVNTWIKNTVIFIGKLGAAVAASGTIIAIARVVIEYLSTP